MHAGRPDAGIGGGADGGSAVLGNSTVSGEACIGAGAIVSGAEDGGVRLGGKLMLFGDVTVTGTQSLAPEAHMTIADDAAFDAAASGQSLEAATGPDQSEYLRATAEYLAHEMGENRADTLFQAQGETESYESNRDTVVDGMYGGMMDAFKGAEEGISRTAFDEERPIESAYHDGLNDAVAEDLAAGGGDAERYAASATAKRWGETSQERADAQKESMRRQVSGRSEWVHGGGGELAKNPNGRQLPDTSGVKEAGPDDGLGIV